MKEKLFLPLHLISAMYRSTTRGGLGFPLFFTLCGTDIVLVVCLALSFSAEGFLLVDKEDGAEGML